MRYYISDLHYFHEGIISADGRNFQTVEDMHKYMIARWNAKVQTNHETVILGDFSLGNPQETMSILKRLNGKKYLIIGNHDKYIYKSGFDKKLFGWIESYKELHDNNRKVLLSHYPLIFYNGQYDLDVLGQPHTYMLHGHVHNFLDARLLINIKKEIRGTVAVGTPGLDGQYLPCNLINCFSILSDYEPLTLDEWLEKEHNED